MNTIIRTELIPLNREGVIKMTTTKGSRLDSVVILNGNPFLCITVSVGSEKEDKTLLVLKIGSSMRSDLQVEDLRYIGSFVVTLPATVLLPGKENQLEQFFLSVYEILKKDILLSVSKDPSKIIS